jgi:hypothetical protein
MRQRLRCRSSQYQGIRILFLLACCLFIFIQYLSIKLFYWEEIPSPTLSRLYSDMPITFDLQSYSVCPPEKLNIEHLTSYYHQYAKQETCFLIEHLGGGPWWRCVTHEFAEILTYLKQLAIQSNINYRLFSHQSDSNRNLTKYFFFKSSIFISISHIRNIFYLCLSFS